MTVTAANIWGKTPVAVRRALLAMALGGGGELYLVGGTVRDWLLGREAADLDLSCAAPAHEVVRRLRRELGGGAIVDLSAAGDETLRLVWRGFQVDVASFRAGTTHIEEDLCLRDFTVNAMAVSLRGVAESQPPTLIDPAGGLVDLQKRRLRHLPGAFEADPLRLLRGYRLAATLGFDLDDATRGEVAAKAAMIRTVAAERVTMELRSIFASPLTSATVKVMEDDRLLPYLFAELSLGRGIEQPGFHHLDVFGHSLLALAKMEEIVAHPGRFFPDQEGPIGQYLGEGPAPARLKWAALLHDLGKPATQSLPADGLGRVTFHRHDQEGARLFAGFAERSRWSREEGERVGRLIAMHMHPFHLCNVARDGRVSAKAILKLCRRAGEELIGLFLLAMADSLASLGTEKPPRMEEELRKLFDQVQGLYVSRIADALHGPPLVTGRDLIDCFDLEPGPLFREVLDEVTTARAEGKVNDRAEALNYVSEVLARRGMGTGLPGFRLVKEP
jgi:poly(A) polymerase